MMINAEEKMRKNFMDEAIRLSLEKSGEGRGGPFGAVIVKDDRIIARGWNEVTSTNDPTAHAEIVAIRRACRKLATFSLEGCEIYINCEPCPMCLAALYWAGIDHIYYAVTRKDAAAIGFADQHIYDELALDVGRRSMIMTQMMRDRALPVFAIWEKRDGKVMY